MIVKREVKVVTEDVTVCDITGSRLGDEPGRASGWAIVRRSDGREVAHFGMLDSLRNNSETLFLAAWDQAGH